MENVTNEDPIGLFGDFRIIRLRKNRLNVLDTIAHDAMIDVANHLRFGVCSDDFTLRQGLREPKGEVP